MHKVKYFFITLAILLATATSVNAVVNFSKDNKHLTLIYTTFMDYPPFGNYHVKYEKYGGKTEKFETIDKAMQYCKENRLEILSKVKAWEKTILEDSAEFGKDYQSILSAAARQVLAAHKLVRNGKGQLLYMSKECHSNGCINTVDVSYPAMPMFLIYTPELIKAMLVGIIEFANMPLWTADFAPHDIGRYPLACGQVYALANPLYLADMKRRADEYKASKNNAMAASTAPAAGGFNF